MTTPVWPASLPQDPLVAAYAEAWRPNFAETPFDDGTMQRRRRFTKPPRTEVTVRFRLDRAQKDTLEDFVHNTLEGGALAFEWTHPTKGGTVRFWLSREGFPKAKADGHGGAFMAELTLLAEAAP